jgi:DNA-binding transcriptional MerR regulator
MIRSKSALAVRDTRAETATIVAMPQMNRTTTMESTSIFTIGDLAREFGVTLRALRFYEDKGLLNPTRDGLTRLYGVQDRDRLRLILKGKRLGFTLVEIRQMIDTEEGNSKDSLAMSADTMREQIAHLERQRVEIDEALAELRKNYETLAR